MSLACGMAQPVWRSRARNIQLPPALTPKPIFAWLSVINVWMQYANTRPQQKDALNCRTSVIGQLPLLLTYKNTVHHFPNVLNFQGRLSLIARVRINNAPWNKVKPSAPILLRPSVQISKLPIANLQVKDSALWGITSALLEYARIWIKLNVLLHQLKSANGLLTHKFAVVRSVPRLRLLLNAHLSTASMELLLVMHVSGIRPRIPAM